MHGGGGGEKRRRNKSRTRDSERPSSLQVPVIYPDAGFIKDIRKGLRRGALLEIENKTHQKNQAPFIEIVTNRLNYKQSQAP